MPCKAMQASKIIFFPHYEPQCCVGQGSAASKAQSGATQGKHCCIPTQLRLEDSNSTKPLYSFPVLAILRAKIRCGKKDGCRDNR